MKIDYSTQNARTFSADILVLPVFQAEAAKVAAPWSSIDEALAGLLTRRAQKDAYEGKASSYLSVDASGVGASRVILAGMGDKARFTSETMRRSIGRLISSLKGQKYEHIAVALPIKSGVDDARLARATAEATLLGTYKYDKFKSKKTAVTIKRISILGTRRAVSIAQGIELGQVGATATNFARELVNEPAQTLTPSELAKHALGLAGSGITVTVHDESALKRMKAGLILAVAQGSAQKPCLIELHYKPKKASTKKLAVIGKGLTFDSGGLSLKPSSGMETMKCDMAGAAAVLGLFHALKVLKPKVEVVGCIGATENMPGGRAQKPGDVVVSMSGKSVEVLNTDAEGRLVLGDVLHYVRTTHKPTAMVDLATLTGACVVALGNWTCGVFGTDKTAGSIMKAAAAADEKAWRMPFDEDLRPKLESPIADMKNIGDRFGGAITAALFLREFVGDSEWAHVDIAGPAFAEGEPKTPGPPGGTGFAVRTLIEWVRSA